MKCIKDYFVLIGKYAFVVLASGLSYVFLAFHFIEKFELQGNDRISLSFEAIANKALFFIDKQKLYLSGRGYYDSKIMLYFFMLFFVILVVSLFIYAFKKKKYLNAAIAFICVIITYCLVYVPGIITTADGVRPLFVLYTMFFVVSCVVLACIKNNRLLTVFSALLIILLSVNIAKTVECEVNLKKMNIMDANWAQAVIADIEDYEKTQGITIENVSICSDMYPNGNYAGTSYLESALRIGYGRENLFILRSQEKERHFNIIQTSNEMYDQYFAGKNWDSFSGTEQIVYIEDTVYICCY